MNPGGGLDMSGSTPGGRPSPGTASPGGGSAATGGPAPAAPAPPAPPSPFVPPVSHRLLLPVRGLAADESPFCRGQDSIGQFLA